MQHVPEGEQTREMTKDQIRESQEKKIMKRLEIHLNYKT